MTKMPSMLLISAVSLLPFMTVGAVNLAAAALEPAAPVAAIAAASVAESAVLPAADADAGEDFAVFEEEEVFANADPCLDGVLEGTLTEDSTPAPVTGFAQAQEPIVVVSVANAPVTGFAVAVEPGLEITHVALVQAEVAPVTGFAIAIEPMVEITQTVTAVETYAAEPVRAASNEPVQVTQVSSLGIAN